MIHRPPDSNAFEFVRVASLRAAQLMRGCTPRVPAGNRPTLTAQYEVAAGKIVILRLDETGHPLPFAHPDVDPVIARVSVRSAASRPQ